jgi:tetratricopeptide (TPR) repeat protein
MAHPDWIPWNTIYDLQLEELQELLQRVRLFPAQRIYIEALVSYSLRDLEGLRNAHQLAELLPSDLPERLDVLEALRLRIAILERSPVRKTSHRGTPEWSGEIHFLTAKHLEVIGEFKEAILHYLDAEKLFDQTQSPKKALKSAFNARVLRGKSESAEKELHTLRSLMDRARDAGDSGVHFAAAQNLAWELGLIGAFSVATSALSEVLEFNASSESTADSIQARILLCDYLYALKLIPEAKLEKERCIAADPGAAEITLNLSERYWSLEKGKIELPSQTLPFPWNERWAQRLKVDSPPKALTPQECKIIEVLLQGPLPRDPLITALFGTQAVASVELTRFYSILKRLRKKIPGLLTFKDELYSL